MQIVDKVCKILNELVNSDELTASEIAERVELPLSTTYRILSSLSAHGLLEKDNRSKRYSLGWALVHLGKNVRDADNYKYMTTKMAPLMKEVVDLTGETVTLATFTGTRVVLISVINGTRSLRFYSQLGREMPWNASAPAKLLLAMQPTKTKKKILTSLQYTSYTDETICDPEVFEKELAQIRKDGVAYSYKELEEFCYAISVPILDANRRAILAITVTGYAPRIEEDQSKIINVLKETAQKAHETFKANGFYL